MRTQCTRRGFVLRGLYTTLLLCACVAALGVGAAAAGATGAPRAVAASVHTADATLATKTKALRHCRRARPGHCSRQLRAVKRARRHLQNARAEFARFQRRTFGSSSSEDEAAPTLSVSGQELNWTKVGSVSSYVLQRRISGQANAESTVTGTAVTPTVQAGVTAHYVVRTNVSGSSWSHEVSITYPASSKTETAKTESVESETSSTGSAAGNLEIGINAGSALMYELPFIEKLHAHTARLAFEITTPVSEMAPIIEAYAKAGVKPLLLACFTGYVPNATEAKNLGAWAAAFGPGGSLWKGKSMPANTAVTDIEFGNETSYSYQFSSSEDTNAGYAARAQAYGVSLKEAYGAIQSTGIKVGILAQGDLGNAGPSWEENMFKAVPGIGSMIAGWTIHPYGPKWESFINSMISATNAVKAPSSIPIYITEWGVSSDNGRCLSENYGWNACMTYSEAASTLSSTFAAIRAKYGARLGGFYIFQAHDQDMTGTSTDREGYFGALQANAEPKGAYTTEVESLLAEDELLS
jgi:hypothetical protein